MLTILSFQQEILQWTTKNKIKFKKKDGSSF